MAEVVAVPQLRYKADIAAGALKIPESRVIADLLLRNVDAAGWSHAIVTQNVLQARRRATALRWTRLIRARLETMGPELWRMIRDGRGPVIAHALLAAAVKHSRLLGDFLYFVVADQYRTFAKELTYHDFDVYLEGCRGRDPTMPQWHECTCKRLRSSMFQMLAQAGYVNDTRSLELQSVHLASPVLCYLHDHDEEYVLRCLQVSP